MVDDSQVKGPASEDRDESDDATVILSSAARASSPAPEEAAPPAPDAARAEEGATVVAGAPPRIPPAPPSEADDTAPRAAAPVARDDATVVAAAPPRMPSPPSAEEPPAARAETSASASSAASAEDATVGAFAPPKMPGAPAPPSAAAAQQSAPAAAPPTARSESDTVLARGPTPPRIPASAPPGSADAADATMLDTSISRRPPPAMPSGGPAPPSPAPAGSAATSDDDDAPTVIGRTIGDDTGADDATVIQASSRLRPRLYVEEPSGSAREVPINTADATVGRAATCDVVLPNPEVSRVHVRLLGRGSQRVLVPVGTRGNTYVNGQRVEGERLLAHGDVIQLATARLTYAENPDRPGLAVGDGARPGRSRMLGVAVAIVAVAVVAYAAYALRGRRPAPPERRPEAAAPVVAPRPPAPAAREAPPVVPPDAAPKAEAKPAAGVDAAAAAQRAERVRQLLYQGDVAYLEKKYTTPPETSAVFAYSEALKLDPANERALTRLGGIIDSYLTWAERAWDQRDRERAQLYATKAAYIHKEVPRAGEQAKIEQRLGALAQKLGMPLAELP